MHRDAHHRKRDVQAVHKKQQECRTGDTDSGAEQRREHVVERLGDSRTGHAHSEQTDIADHVGKAVHHVEHEHRDADKVLLEPLGRHRKEHEKYRFHDEHRDDELRHVDTEHHLAFLLLGVPHTTVWVGLYCKAPRAHLRHARAALATAPQRRPKGSLSLTQMRQEPPFIHIYKDSSNFLKSRSPICRPLERRISTASRISSAERNPSL